MNRRNDPFAPGTPGRKCEYCKRGGAVSRYLGTWAHLKCQTKAQKEGRANMYPTTHKRKEES